MTKLSTKNIIQRKSKKDWFEEALKSIEFGGVDSIVIEHLAASLNVSKSGFYWHFKNRSDLLNQVLKYWSKEYTEILTSNSLPEDLTPREKLFYISKSIYENDLAKYDLAIRTWAKYDLKAKRVASKVNKLRLDFIRSIFTELGFKDDELEARTKLFVCYQTFETPMFGKLSQTNWERLAKRRIKILTGE
jgi:AcrR family transcriptional regulator